MRGEKGEGVKEGKRRTRGRRERTKDEGTRARGKAHPQVVQPCQVSE